MTRLCHGMGRFGNAGKQNRVLAFIAYRFLINAGMDAINAGFLK
jgi:hypothetical protein